MATSCWAVWLFWLSLAAVMYPYAIYPVLLAAWNRLAGRRLPDPDPGHRPRVFEADRPRVRRGHHHGAHALAPERIDGDGKIVKIFDKVNVAEHADEVLEAFGEK